MPTAHASALPGTYPSAPNQKGQRREADRPPVNETQQRQCDPGWFSQIIELCNQRHVGLTVNVNYIYIASVAPAVKGGPHTPERFSVVAMGRPKPRKYISKAASSRSSADIGSARPAASPRSN